MMKQLKPTKRINQLTNNYVSIKYIQLIFVFCTEENLSSIAGNMEFMHQLQILTEIVFVYFALMTMDLFLFPNYE